MNVMARPWRCRSTLAQWVDALKDDVKRA